MSTLAKLITSQTSRLRPSPVYTEARARHAALAPYESPAALIAAMGRHASLSRSRRDAIIRALVTEHQGSGHSLWAAVLMAVFQPMLLGVRRLVTAHEGGDADQNVILAFLEALQQVSSGRLTTLALRSATQKGFRRAMRLARGAGSEVALEDHEDAAELAYDPLREGVHADLEREEVTSVVQEIGGEPLLDAMVALHDTEITLRDYVAQAYPTATPRVRDLAYEALKRDRARVATRLRARRARRTSAAA